MTKILDGAFYSIGRLLPEEDSPERGAPAPSEGPDTDKKRGEGSPKPPAETKEEAVESSHGDAKPSRGSAGDRSITLLADQGGAGEEYNGS